jgi:hypothetical protein
LPSLRWNGAEFNPSGYEEAVAKLAAIFDRLAATRLRSKASGLVQPIDDGSM